MKIGLFAIRLFVNSFIDLLSKQCTFSITIDAFHVKDLGAFNLHLLEFTFNYSVSHIITYPSKELCSKMALGEVGVSLP